MLAGLLWIQLITTIFLVGMIWTIQVVSYPLFVLVPASGAKQYHAEHVRRITPLVAPPMLVEVLCTGMLLLVDSGPLRWFGAALLAIVWLSTALWQVPAHGQLAENFNPAIARGLVRSNWLRTIAWTVRGAVVVAMFLRL